MFTMAKIKDGSSYLERHLAANDYYSEQETVVGPLAATKQRPRET
jgi:hypothetical protein